MIIGKVLTSFACFVFLATAVPAKTTETLTRYDVAQAFKFFEKKSQGTVGAAAMDLQTGELIELNGDKPFPMQSVYKMAIGMAVLDQVDDGKLALDQSVRLEPKDYMPAKIYSPIRDKNPQGGNFTILELIQPMVSLSDNSSSDFLLKLIGGPAAADSYMKDIGSTQVLIRNYELEIQTDPKLQYLNSSTPNAMVDLLAKLHRGEGLSSGSQQVLMKIMRETSTGPGRLKGKLPKTVVVAHKTGTSGEVDGMAAATNDVGIIEMPNGRKIAVAVFVCDSKADEATRDDVIASIASVVMGYFGDSKDKF